MAEIMSEPDKVIQEMRLELDKAYEIMYLALGAMDYFSGYSPLSDMIWDIGEGKKIDKDRLSIIKARFGILSDSSDLIPVAVKSIKKVISYLDNA